MNYLQMMSSGMQKEHKHFISVDNQAALAQYVG